MLELLLIALALGVQQERPRELPPTKVGPRSFAGWHARSQDSESRGSTFVEVYPEYRREFEALQSRSRRLSQEFDAASNTFALDPATAGRLIDELYADMGHPDLNYVWQDYVVNFVIRKVGTRQNGVDPVARDILVAGILEYVGAGGGQASPAIRARLADTLDRLAPGDPVAQATVEMLLTDALQWAEEIQVPTELKLVYRQCAKRWGDAFWLYAFDVERGPLPQPHPKRYTKAVRALETLLTVPDPAADEHFHRRLHDAAKLAAARFDDPVFEDDLTCRLLIAYRVMLRRKEAPLPERAVEYIDDSLLRLARQADRLRTQRHWKLWGEAVAALRPARMSRPLLSFVRALLRRPGEIPEAQRAALAPLALYHPGVWVPGPFPAARGGG